MDELDINSWSWEIFIWAVGGRTWEDRTIAISLKDLIMSYGNDLDLDVDNKQSFTCM